MYNQGGLHDTQYFTNHITHRIGYLYGHDATTITGRSLLLTPLNNSNQMPASLTRWLFFCKNDARHSMPVPLRESGSELYTAMAGTAFALLAIFTE
jgi:hypothetical protein